MDVGRWLEALRDPAVELAVHDGGLPRRRYAARSGWSTGPRMLEDHLIYAVQAGEAVLESAGRGTVLTAGCGCIVPPGVPFLVRSGARAPRLGRLRLRVVRGGRPLAWGGEAVVFTVTPELRRVLDLLTDAASAGAHAAEWDRACAQLLGAAVARACAPRTAGALPAQALAMCRAALLRDPLLAPRDLARICGLSHDWFARAFRRATGRPPRRWLVEERVRQAAELLASGHEAARPLARRLGWRDAKLFGRQFRAVMGAPPARWRRAVV